MRRLLRRARAMWRNVVPRGNSYSADLASQQRAGQAPNIDGHGGFGGQ